MKTMFGKIFLERAKSVDTVDISGSLVYTEASGTPVVIPLSVVIKLYEFAEVTLGDDFETACRLARELSARQEKNGLLGYPHTISSNNYHLKDDVRRDIETQIADTMN